MSKIIKIIKIIKKGFSILKILRIGTIKEPTRTETMLKSNAKILMGEHTQDPHYRVFLECP